MRELSVGRRFLRAALPWVAVILLNCTQTAAAQTHGDIVRVLAEEKTLGETMVALLNQYAKNDQTVYVQGIVKYAEAKAKFDGLIEQLKADLQAGRNPGQSPQFKQALQQASEKRQALSAFVAQQLTHPTGNTKGAPALAAVAELIPSVSDAAIKLWHEFRDARTVQQDAIRQQLDAQKWLPFERFAQTGANP